MSQIFKQAHGVKLHSPIIVIIYNTTRPLVSSKLCLFVPRQELHHTAACVAAAGIAVVLSLGVALGITVGALMLVVVIAYMRR